MSGQSEQAPSNESEEPDGQPLLSTPTTEKEEISTNPEQESLLTAAPPATHNQPTNQPTQPTAEPTITQKDESQVKLDVQPKPTLKLTTSIKDEQQPHPEFRYPFFPSRSSTGQTDLQTSSLPAYRKPDKKPTIVGLNLFRSSNTRVSFDDGEHREIDPAHERFVISAAELDEPLVVQTPGASRVVKEEIATAHHYSFRESASKIIDKETELKKDGKNTQLCGYQLRLAFSSLGIVFGDVGTSPLYTFSSVFPDAPPSREDTLGALSLIIWTIVMIVAIKYITFMLMASDRGEGGPFALYSLLSRNLKHHIKDPILLGRVTYIFELLACIGVASVLSDGVLTPSISVLSAVQGLEVAANVDSKVVVGVSIAIVLVLFLIQQLGTSRVSFLFSPLMVIWFASLFSIGVYNITFEPEVLAAFSPAVGAEFFGRRKYEGWVTLGAVFLCVTGFSPV